MELCRRNTDLDRFKIWVYNRNTIQEGSEGGLMMTEHVHALSYLGGILTQYCSCGVRICQTLHPKEGTGCTLKEGHSGPHFNGWKPKLGTWSNTETRWQIPSSLGNTVSTP